MTSIAITSIFLIAGAFFSLLAAIGVLRFPDLYTRMHAATKAPAFGLLLLQTAAAVYFSSLYTTLISILVIVIIFLTAPVASHLISRVAHYTGTQKWSKTLVDELESESIIPEESEKTGGKEPS